MTSKKQTKRFGSEIQKRLHTEGLRLLLRIEHRKKQVQRMGAEGASLRDIEKALQA